MDELNKFLPAAWSHNNPIDILGDASAERYAKALEIAANDPNSDGLLVILTPQAMTDPTATAEKLKAFGHDRRQAGAGQLDGRRRRGGRRGHPEPRRHPDLRLSRHGGRSSSPTCGATPTTCAACTKRRVPAADPADVEAGRAKAAGHDRGGPQDRPHHPDRVRIEAAARPPTASRPSRPRSPRPKPTAAKRRRGDRLPRRAQAVLRDDHAQDRRRRRAVEPARTTPLSARPSATSSRP